MDVYKPARSSEEFRYRIESLAGICGSLNKPILCTKLDKDPTIEQGSISLLEEYLDNLAGADMASAVCSVFKNINVLRQGYPTHGDNVRNFLNAHDFFSIPYPIEGFVTAWETILGAYFGALKELRGILSSERTNNP